MSYTPFQAPLLGALLGDQEIAACFSVKAELAAMLRFEAALARVCAAHRFIPENAAGAIATLCETFEPDLPAISAATARDGVCVPELVRQLREAAGEGGPHVHFGATSQDVTDTALVLRLKDVSAILSKRLDKIIAGLDALADKFGSNPLTGRTRMQAALQITVDDRLGAWRAGVGEARERLDTNFEAMNRLQFGGPAGTLDSFGGKAQLVSVDLAHALGLFNPPRNWHANRVATADLASSLSIVTGSLGKIGQDVALMAQNEIGEIELSGGGESSAMPHKQNPVLAEALVTLARFNATLVSGMHQSLVHEQERSGSAWMLEWMILPQMCVAAGAAARNMVSLLENVDALGSS